MTRNTKISRVLLALTLALLLSLTAALPALASTLPALVGTADDTPPIAITKIFQTPEGTPIPTVLFEFNIEKYGIGSEDTKIGQMPTIGSVSIPISSTDAKSTSNYITTIVKEELIDLSGLNFSGGPGQYIYTITEERPVVYPQISGQYTMYTYDSQAKYELSLYVDENTDPSDLYIKYITVRKLVKDNGESLGDYAEKVDPSPGAHGLAFVNTYVRANDGEPGSTEHPGPDPDPVDYDNLYIKKEVTDASLYVNTYFPFRITITNPVFAEDTVDEQILDLPSVYKAYVMDGADTVVNSADNNGTATSGTDSNGKYYIFPVGTAATVKLKHNERLVFTRTPVGEKWVAVEALTGAGAPINTFTASILVCVNNEKDPVIVGVKGQDATTFDRLVGNDITYAVFENDTADVIPLGLDINNLPYYGIIAIAVAALAAYVVVKTRKARKSAHN